MLPRGKKFSIIVVVVSTPVMEMEMEMQLRMLAQVNPQLVARYGPEDDDLIEAMLNPIAGHWGV